MQTSKGNKSANPKGNIQGQKTLSNDGKKKYGLEEEHGYAMDTSAHVLNKRERGDDSVPTTPSKGQGDKRPKMMSEDEVSNTTILEAILKLEKRVDEQLADLSLQIKQCNVMIASLAKAVEFNAEEVKECRKKVEELEKQNSLLSKTNEELKERVREQERYRMRGCLYIKGLEEKKDEDIRAQVVQLLGRIVPDMKIKMEEAVDIAHRTGKKIDNKNRHVMVMFSQRRWKEEIWRRSKNSIVCREEGIRLAEVFTREDLEERRRIWPLIEQARKAGKRAFYRGAHGYIDGRRIEDDK